MNATQKPIELSRQQKIDNATIHALMTLFFACKSLVWYVRGSVTRWQKWHRLPSLPVYLVVAGSDPLACLNALESYGVYAAPASIRWDIVWDEVRLSSAILVSKSQWEYADNILYQTGCDAYLIATKASPKRGQTLPRPYGARVRTASLAPKQARLGKTYTGRGSR